MYSLKFQTLYNFYKIIYYKYVSLAIRIMFYTYLSKDLYSSELTEYQKSNSPIRLVKISISPSIEPVDDNALGYVFTEI